MDHYSLLIVSNYYAQGWNEWREKDTNVKLLRDKKRLKKRKNSSNVERGWKNDLKKTEIK